MNLVYVYYVYIKVNERLWYSNQCMQFSLLFMVKCERLTAKNDCSFHYTKCTTQHIPSISNKSIRYAIYNRRSICSSLEYFTYLKCMCTGLCLCLKPKHIFIKNICQIQIENTNRWAHWRHSVEQKINSITDTYLCIHTKSCIFIIANWLTYARNAGIVLSVVDRHVYQTKTQQTVCCASRLIESSQIESNQFNF